VTADPVSEDEFAAAMAPLGPFEPRPMLGVAVSGGPDSMALALLADRWARQRGGGVRALIVDHALRPDSAAEAAATAERLAARGIASEILVRDGPKPTRAIQQAARDARYALLWQACRRQGLLHLLTAHTRDDQAETLLLRLAHGSGLDGLAGMASVREADWGRLLRPLLGLAKARLVATCAAAGVTVVRDSSNRDIRYARGRLRGVEAALAAEGLTAARLAETARKAGRARAALDAAAADLLARAAWPQPEGWIRLDRDVIARASEETARRAVARCLAAVAGRALPPRAERLDRLVSAVRQGDDLGAGRTLGGCRILPRGAGGRYLAICREAAAIAPLTLSGPGTVDWDGRFRVTVSPEAWPTRAAGPVEIVAAGAAAPGTSRSGADAVPAAARRALPALSVGGIIMDTAEIDGRNTPGLSVRLSSVRACWRPLQVMAGPAFGIA
jgi:tRNA(Ile)-lysidine synthase